MGRIYLRTIAECERRGVILRITCRSCGREHYLGPTELLGMRILGQPINRMQSLVTLEPHLRCRGAGEEVGCGARSATIRPVWSHEIAGLPRGVPVLPWLRGTAAERAALERGAKGTQP